MQAPQCGHREGMENEDLPLEKKVFRIDLPKPVIDI